MNETERIAKLFDRAVAEGAFAGPLPFGSDVFVEAAKYLRQLDAHAATIAEFQRFENEAVAVLRGYLVDHQERCRIVWEQTTDGGRLVSDTTCEWCRRCGELLTGAASREQP
jgi:hypothetical protein